mgnify:CR=1 FL=1
MKKIENGYAIVCGTSDNMSFVASKYHSFSTGDLYYLVSNLQSATFFSELDDAESYLGMLKDADNRDNLTIYPPHILHSSINPDELYIHPVSKTLDITYYNNHIEKFQDFDVSKTKFYVLVAIDSETKMDVYVNWFWSDLETLHVYICNSLIYHKMNTSADSVNNMISIIKNMDNVIYQDGCNIDVNTLRVQEVLCVTTTEYYT